METKNSTPTATDQVEEPKTVAQEPAAPAEAPAAENTAENLISRMRVKREEVEPPKFLDESDFIGGGDTGSGEEGEDAPDTDEPLTDDDKSNLEYLDYADEHATTATFGIMTLDRVVASGCGFLARESPEAYRKFESKSSISQDYLDVTAALVKKYQAKMSLEYIFLATVLAIYAPSLTMAYSKGKMKKAQEQAKKST